LSSMSCAAYLPLPSTPCGDRSGLRPTAPTTPFADFCAALNGLAVVSVLIPGHGADLPR
jgi:hypothetical protein